MENNAAVDEYFNSTRARVSDSRWSRAIMERGRGGKLDGLIKVFFLLHARY
ncbi:MAG: hypothetical protein H7Z13_14080 [Ferruginibacter sp.]|nr:hypothetical protein [Ferruginibacter sp.]